MMLGQVLDLAKRSGNISCSQPSGWEGAPPQARKKQKSFVGSLGTIFSVVSYYPDCLLKMVESASLCTMSRQGLGMPACAWKLRPRNAPLPHPWPTRADLLVGC